MLSSGDAAATSDLRSRSVELGARLALLKIVGICHPEPSTFTCAEKLFFPNLDRVGTASPKAASTGDSPSQSFLFYLV